MMCSCMNMQGQQQTVLFCGDGLNDLAALGTAEVGMAIGPIDAMAAAPISTKHSSIAGCTSSPSHLLKSTHAKPAHSLPAMLLSTCWACAMLHTCALSGWTMQCRMPSWSPPIIALHPDVGKRKTCNQYFTCASVEHDHLMRAMCWLQAVRCSKEF